VYSFYRNSIIVLRKTLILSKRVQYTLLSLRDSFIASSTISQTLFKRSSTKGTNWNSRLSSPASPLLLRRLATVTPPSLPHLERGCCVVCASIFSAYRCLPVTTFNQPCYLSVQEKKGEKLQRIKQITLYQSCKYKSNAHSLGFCQRLCYRANCLSDRLSAVTLDNSPRSCCILRSVLLTSFSC
jgi:hypothetical protein